MNLALNENMKKKKKEKKKKKKKKGREEILPQTANKRLLLKTPLYTATAAASTHCIHYH